MTEPAPRRGGLSTLQLVVVIVALFVVATLLLLLAVFLGRRTGDLGGGDDPPPGRAATGGGELIRLAAVPASAEKLPANRFCEQAVATAVGVVECDLRPLGVVDATRCPPVGLADSSTTTTVTIRPRESDAACAPLDRAVATQLIGWIVSVRGTERRVSIYVGPAPAEPSTVPDSVPRTVEPTLVERFRAADTDGRTWSEIAVCPRDVDRDGLLDLVLEARPTDRAGATVGARLDEAASATPEVVALFVPVAGVTERRGGPLRSYRFDTPWPRTTGRGCASPAVRALGYEDDRLTLPSLRALQIVLPSSTTANPASVSATTSR